MQATTITTAATVLAVTLTVAILAWARRFVRPAPGAAAVSLLGTYSPVLTWLNDRRWLPRAKLVVRQWWRVLPRANLLELAAIALWAVFVGRVYLDFNPLHWPAGGDWALNVQGYFPWTWLRQCGVCVLWNGSLNGGAPAFVELVSALLHPVWIVSILLFGVINASKVAIVAGLIMAGWAQWWLAKTTRLSGVARLWSSALVVVGGHLAGRLEGGLVELVFALGATSLALAAAVDLAVTGRRRAVALLGLTLGLSLLSVTGYIQIGLIMCIFPGLVFFLFTSRFKRRPVLKSFVVAGAIALLLAAVWWVPLLHFWPNLGKQTSDPSFNQVQPLEQLLINLVIPDGSYYGAQLAAGHAFYAAWFASYIGWVPLILAALALRLAPRRWLRLLVFSILGIALAYLTASAVLLKWLLPIAPALVLSLREPSLITGLAVPLILLLAAIGLDALWRLNWPALLVRQSNKTSPLLGLRWLLLVPLLWSVRSAYIAAEQYMGLGDIPPVYYGLLASKELAGKQWVTLPYGEATFTVIGLQSGLKLTDVVRPWYWRDHTPPAAHSEFTRQLPEGSQAVPEAEVYFVDHPETNYASIDQPAGPVPCAGQSIGGYIDLTCTTSTAGQLVVMENAWSGWQVWRDGAPAGLTAGQWLTTPAPAGTHHYVFRYLPWDVLLGLLLTLTGLVWLARLVFRPARRPPLAGV